MLKKGARYLIFFLLILAIFFVPQKVLGRTLRQRQIVVFKEEVGGGEQNEVLDRLEIKSDKILLLINARAIRLTADETKRLARDPRVLRIDPDIEVFALPRQDLCNRYPWLPWCSQPTPTPEPTATPTPTVSEPTATPTPISANQPLPWGIAKIDSDDAWLTASGSGVKVAILDTGIDLDHPDLDDNLAGCQNLIYSWRNCDDDNGHGTHVSGIIAAENNNFGVVGVAPQAKIYSLKVLNNKGSGYLSDIIEGLDWAVANQIQVINMSLGTTSNVASFQEAVQRVNDAGIVQVAAAGNSGPGDNTVLYPAKYPQVIAISATDQNDQVPSWSSRGQQIDLAAPGKDIYSTYLKGQYKILSGTSMASPHAVGVVALRLEGHPSESPEAIRNILTSNATALPLDTTWVGSGLLNAYKVISAP